MDYYIYGLLALITLIIQITLSPTLSGDITPDLLLVVMVLLAIYRGKVVGGIFGFVAGFLQDWFSGGLFGVHAISKVIVGYIYGFLKNRIYERNVMVPPLVIFLATLLNQLLIILFSDYLITEVFIRPAFRLTVISLATYNSLVAVFIAPVVRKMHKFLAERGF